MAFAYALYFVFPLVLCVLLYAQRRQEDFRQVVMAIVLVFYVGFAGYILFPAVGPRIYIPLHHPERYTIPLHGALGFYDWSAAMWDRLQRVSSDAFPSLHTACSATALYFAFRFGDVLRPRWLLGVIFAPLVVSLWISTVYLRQHWVIDVIAGLGLTAACCWLSGKVRSLFARWAPGR
jgi:membrane-associated phospholipid phosphatase